jgi:hypothetical protein
MVPLHRGRGVDDSNIDQGYKEVLRRVKEMRTPYFDPFQVKLIRGDHPLALAVAEVLQRYPVGSAINYNGRNLGGTSIEGAYIYRLPHVSPACQSNLGFTADSDPIGRRANPLSWDAVQVEFSSPVL